MKYLVLLVLFASQATEEGPRALIDQLRSDQPALRESAARKLAVLGELAESELRKESGSADTEFAARVKSLLDSIERKRSEKAWDERVRKLPETCPEARWTFLKAGQWAGSLLLKTRRVDEVLIFEDRYEFQWKERRISVDLNQSSSADRHFGLIRLEALSSESVWSHSADISDSKLRLRRGEKTEERDVPANLLAGFALFRAAPLLPKQKNFVFRCFLVDQTGTLSDEVVLTGLGEEELTHEGKALKTWKWAMQEQTAKTKDPEAFIWVSENLVVRMGTPAGAYVLSSPLR